MGFITRKFVLDFPFKNYYTWFTCKKKAIFTMNGGKKRTIKVGNVIIDITMSLDGFVTAPNDKPEWVFDGKPAADAKEGG